MEHINEDNKMSDDKNKLIIKNLISFILSFFPRFSMILFALCLKSENIDFKDAMDNAFGIIAFGPFALIILCMSLLIALPAFIMTIKYMIEIIKSKKKIVIPIIEILIYILEIIRFTK